MIDDKQTPHLKMPLKGELIRRVTQRYPSLDVGTVEVVTGIQSLAKSLSARMNHEIAAYGLTEGKFYVLTYLFSEELLGHGDPGPSDIADNLGVTRATVTGLLDGLERDGYLERLHDHHDRRALTIRMTDRARRFLDEYVPTSACSMGGLTSVLDPDEQKTLLALLAKLDKALHHSSEQ